MDPIEDLLISRRSSGTDSGKSRPQAHVQRHASISPRSLVTVTLGECYESEEGPPLPYILPGVYTSLVQRTNDCEHLSAGKSSCPHPNRTNSRPHPGSLHSIPSSVGKRKTPRIAPSFDAYASASIRKKEASSPGSAVPALATSKTGKVVA